MRRGQKHAFSQITFPKDLDHISVLYRRRSGHAEKHLANSKGKFRG
jgi:hypothetical protein